MSRNKKPQWSEPVAAIIVEVDDPIENTIEVGVISLADGPLDPVPLGESQYNRADDSYSHANNSAPHTLVGTTPDFSEPLQNSGQNKGIDDVAQKTQDAVQGVADKAKDAASDAADRAKDAAAGVADKAKEAADKLAASVSDATSAAKDAAADTGVAAKSLTAKIGSAGATGAQSAGTALWTLVQRSPLQALVFFASLIWLIRHNRTSATLPPVSLNDAAGKVGTAAGQVQATLGTLGGQVQDQAQRGVGWFGQTLQTSPLVLGAMALIGGAALGLSVPETSYEDQLLGKKRDELVGKVQEAAQDLTQKVTTVAQVAVHEAVESVKEEAQKQGLSGELTPESIPQDLSKIAGKAQDAAQNLTGKVTAAAQGEAKKQGLTGGPKPDSAPQGQTQGQS